MSSFDARLRMPGQTRIPMSVVVDVSEDRIAFTRGDQLLGDWPLGEVVIDPRPDGFHLKLDEEEIVLNVHDSDGFAGVLAARRLDRPLGLATDVGTRSSNGVDKGNGLAGRLEKVTPEERFDDLRERIDQLSVDLTDEAVEPSEAFGRWLRLLKELNLRHGQGSMPTPLFYRFNTDLLDLIPAPARPAPGERATA